MQRLALGTHLLDGLVDQGKHLLDPRKQIAALGRQAQAPGLAHEQGITQVIFQSGDLPAHRTLGDMQLLRRLGEVAALGGDEKGMQGRQGGKALHGSSRMTSGHG
ncbi:hypothetical protein D3C80_1362460 [compost metagenome]